MTKSQIEIDRKILELFNEKEVWESQSAIIKRLALDDIHRSQSTVHRSLLRLGAEQTADGWNLNHAKVYQENLAELKEMMGNMAEKQPLFDVQISTAILRTKPNYNRVIAKKIQETFADDVLSVFCPNEVDVIIYYKCNKDGTFESEMCNMLGYTLE